MDIRTYGRAVLALLIGLWAAPVAAADLTIPGGGKISVELISSNAAFRNTLSIVQPSGAVVAVTGCKLEPANGLGGVHVLSEKNSQHGCRVTLDADGSTGGVQGFPANVTFRFGMCAQTDADPDCEFVWSSDSASNSDSQDHVQTTPIQPGQFPDQIFRLNWEDQNNLGDNDFDDLIVVVRSDLDSDGDGLWDDWEQFGIDADGNGTVDVNLPGAGANRLHKDVFVEVDWMDCTLAGSDCAAMDTHNHRPNAAAVTAAVNSFANANVTNPDGVNGITLHVDVSNAFAHQNFLIIPGACFAGAAGTGFDAVKAANFNTNRRFAYHYNLWTHRQTSGDGGSSGCGELPGNDFQVSLGAWNGQVGTIMDQAGTFLHELGHNLNLHHGGGDDTNFKPNYLSVMSYRYQVSGIPPTDPDGGGPLTARMDYSRAALPNLVESNLNEPNGVQDGTDNIFFSCPNATLSSGVGNAGIDWNCNSNATNTGVANDINGDTAQTTLTGFSDWVNIKYDFQNTGDFEDGAHLPIVDVELSYEKAVEVLFPDLAIFKAAAPDVVLTGSNVTYSMTPTNKRPVAAPNVLVEDTLPPTTTFVSCNSTHGGACGGSGNTRTVAFPSLTGGVAPLITLVANVNCAVPHGSLISNTATVNFAGDTPDPDLTDNLFNAVVTASNPPPTITGQAVNRPVLWPPNHKLVDVAVSYNVTDNCGVPVCALSVASNEPINGLGDGDTAPDWEIVSPTLVRLRAERSGGGTGRLYTMTVTCTDSGGGSSSQAVTVAVPHSR